MESKGSCRFLAALKRQMIRSGVMAYSSVTYEKMKFYENWTSNEPFLSGVILKIAKINGVMASRFYTTWW